MNRKGFTLTELLVVIAIIGVLSVIIIPSVVKINESINEREYEQRKAYIETAAETYASDKPDIFQGEDEAYVYVWQLVSEGYLNTDTEATDEVCRWVSNIADGSGLKEIKDNSSLSNTLLSSGCVSDPRYSTSLNSKSVRLIRKTVGVVAELVNDRETIGDDGSIDTLVRKVCKAISSGAVSGKSLNGESCACVYEGDDDKNDVVALTGDGISCIISSADDSGNVNNWLKYGSSTANWRVVGLYSIKKDTASGNPNCATDRANCEVVAKIITSGVVD